MKRFGDTKTSLTLTEKAQIAYNETDPLDIYEVEDGTFEVDGVMRLFNCTADDINNYLEELYYDTHPTYYFPNSDVDLDSIYGNQDPVCIDEEELNRLAKEWGGDLFDRFHEASEKEIDQYGVYDS